MSVSVASAQAAAKKDEGKFLKFLKAVKKFLAKEFLWILFAALVAIPIALIICYTIPKATTWIEYAEILKLLDGKPLLLVCYVVSLGGVYFGRMVIGAIKTLTAKKPTTS